MLTNDFLYDLPIELIAEKPMSQREDSRLLICDKKSNKILDKNFADLPGLIKTVFCGKPVLFIVNNSKVYKARLFLRRKTGAKIEVFVLEKKENDAGGYPVLVRGHLREGEVLYHEKTPILRILTLNAISSVSFFEPIDSVLERLACLPLPSYIEKKRAKLKQEEQNENEEQKEEVLTADKSWAILDKERYQTVYAQEEGSVAAPTAGLHFTEDIMKQCEEQGAVFCPVMLHVGLGTFRPVSTPEISQHIMHKERYLIPQKTLESILEFKKKGYPIVFVGTTSFRCIESFFRANYESFLQSKYEDLLSQADKILETDIFIYPDNEDNVYHPVIGEAILTNFHQPGSTLVMLVASLLGVSLWRDLYAHALSKKYRFLSYGDSSLLLFGQKEEINE